MLDLAFWQMVMSTAILVVPVIGFGLFAYVVFGDFALPFSNLPTVFFSLMQMSLGNIDYGGCDSAFP